MRGSDSRLQNLGLLRRKIDLDQVAPPGAEYAIRHAAAGNDLRVAAITQGDAIMGILSWIILGLIAGFIGSRIVDRRGQGLWLDMALGIIGALVGGFLFDLFGASGVTGLNIYSMLVAIVGSVVVLLIYNAVMGSRHA
jgi:uncharacterized membrane protein YeaQ/YmgE (transglycosylase-associated protein family)